MPPAQTKQGPGIKQVIIRMPVDLHRELVVAADAQKRSVNAHLNFLVERSLDHETSKSEAA